MSVKNAYSTIYVKYASLSYKRVFNSQQAIGLLSMLLFDVFVGAHITLKPLQ